MKEKRDLVEKCFNFCEKYKKYALKPLYDAFMISLAIINYDLNEYDLPKFKFFLRSAPDYLIDFL